MDIKETIVGALTKGGTVELAIEIAEDVITKVNELITLYETQIKIENSLSKAIMLTGQSAQYTVGDLKNMASALQTVTAHSNETILPIMQLLIETTKLSKDSMPLATETVLDLSTALGVDLKSAANTVSTILNDPASAIDKLRRLNVELSTEQENSILKFVAQGNQAKAQKIILDQLAESYGGLARAEGELLTSKTTQFQNAWADVKEEIGRGLSLTITPILSPLVNWGTDFLTQVKNQLATSNNIASKAEVTQLSGNDLNAAYNELAPKMESWTKYRNEAESAGDYEAVTAYNDVIDMFDEYFTALADEINIRAQSSRWVAMDVQGQQELTRIQDAKFFSGGTADAYQATVNEQLFERSVLRGQGVDTSSTYSAKKVGEAIQEETAQTETDAIKKTVQMAHDLLTAKEAVYAISGNTVELEKTRILLQIEGLETQKKAYHTKIEEGKLTAESISEYEQLIGLLDDQIALQQEAFNDVEHNAQQKELNVFLSANSVLIQRTTADEIADYEKIIEEATKLTGLNDEQQKQLDAIVLSTKEHVTALENSEKIAQQKELTHFFQSNKDLLDETILDEVAHYNAIIDSAMAQKQLTDLTAEQNRQLDEIISNAEKQKKAIYTNNSPLSQFIGNNSGYLASPEEPTREQKTDELWDKRKNAVSYLTDIENKQQREIPITPEDTANAESLREIIAGIDSELDNLSEKGIFEELHDALNLDMLKEGDITGFLSNIEEAVANAKEIIQKNFGDIISFGKGFFQTFSKLNNENSESELEILEKRIAEEEQLRDQQLQRNQDRYDEQSDSLEQLYAFGKISHEDYIAGQLALDEEKAKSDEEAVAGVEELERQKLEIENKAAKAEFENNKRQNMSDAAMSGAAAFVQALKLGPIAGPIAAAVIAGMTVAQIAVIGSQQFTPKTALAQGGIVSSPTTALIGEGGEPEMVLPLSKAEDMGFSKRNETRIIININAPTYTGEDLTDCVYEGIRLAQRTGRLPRWN